MITSLDISASALVAQRTRINVIANNIANISTTRNEDGQAEAFQARFPVFQTDAETATLNGAMGVRVSSVEFDNKEPLLKYEPQHPDADDNGYVAYPNINLMEQMVDSMEASRAYEANVTVIEVSNSMARQTLNILI